MYSVLVLKHRESQRPGVCDPARSSAIVAGSKVLFKWPSGAVIPDGFSFEAEFPEGPRDATRPTSPALVIESVRMEVAAYL